MDRRIINNKVRWYDHQLRAVEENESTKILWGFSVQTDHTIPHNKPDIVIVDERTNEATIIDVAVANDHNLAQKRLDKLRAYTDLSVEIKSLWNLTKVTIVPVIIGAIGTLYSHFKTDIQKIPFENLELEQYEMQKIALYLEKHYCEKFSPYSLIIFLLN